MQRSIYRCGPWGTVLLSAALWAAAAPAPAFGGTVPFPTERPVMLFVLAGQSNALGLGPVADLMPSPDAFVRDDVLIFRNGGAGWEPLEPGQGRMPDEFGPELTLGATLQDLFPDHQVALIKHAPGGTSLASDWNPNVGNAAALDQLAAKIGDALVPLNDAGVAFEFSGTFWVQGEADARDAQAAADYGANLLALMGALRTVTGASPFTMARISANLPDDLFEFRELVRATFDQVAGADPLATLVDTDDLTLQDDQIHYTAASYLSLGARLAQAHHALVVAPEPARLLLSFGVALAAVAGALRRRAAASRPGS